MILCPNWHCTIEGREKIPNHRASVIVANHQSLVDILALYGLNRHFKWVSKEAIFKLPFIGWNMSLNNYVRLKRGRRSSILSMMDSCHRHIRRGNSILLFPEGTRSKNGEILAFKQGAFNLAVEADIPIVPIIIDGTTTALPKSGWIMRVDQRVQIQVRVLDPVSPAEYQGEAEQLAKAVRVQMMQALADIQQPSPPL